MLTKYFAKLLGLWILIAVLSIFANRDSSIAMMNALFGDTPLVFITGVFTVVIGLAIVIAHNRWHDGLLALVVTLYGWIATIKGALFLILPPSEQARLWDALHFQEHFYAYFIFALVVGTYLTYEGFRASPRDSTN
jgi:cytochrome bd-type quinol oxidase subunit 2